MDGVNNYIVIHPDQLVQTMLAYFVRIVTLRESCLNSITGIASLTNPRVVVMVIYSLLGSNQRKEAMNLTFCLLNQELRRTNNE
jgi:hypothetical protein